MGLIHRIKNRLRLLKKEEFYRRNGLLITNQIINSLHSPSASASIIALAKSMDSTPIFLYDSSNIERYLDLVRPKVGVNAPLVRIGSNGDGGYLVLSSLLLPPPLHSFKHSA